MFHVKQPDILTCEIDRLIGIYRDSSVGSLAIDQFHLSALGSLMHQLPGMKLLVCDDKIVDSAIEYLQPRWGVDRGLILVSSSNESLTPEGFITPQQKNLDTAISALSSLPHQVSYIVTTEKDLATPVIPIKKSPPMLLDAASQYDALLEWISASGYDRVDTVVSRGSYSVRGGIVDVFSYIAPGPVRANFIDSVCTLFMFDVDSQLTLERISAYPVSKKSNTGPMATIQDHFGGRALWVSLKKLDTVQLGQSQNPSRTIFSLQPIPLKAYLAAKRAGSQGFQFSDSLTSTGFRGDSGDIVVPSWFDGRDLAHDRGKNPQPAFDKDYFIDDLNVGDYVVHRDHGVGVYLGLKSEDINGQIAEYIILEYEDGGIVSLSTDRFNKLSYYASQDDRGVALDSLSKQAAWGRRLLRAKKQADEAVEFLVNLYAERSTSSRTPYQIDIDAESVFLSRFVHEDTPDQKNTWDDISKDLTKSVPMNRLLCGDVGFGKTEIAIRAAFRVVFGGKRVAVLAPTTILANQLYSAFQSRLSEFSIEVDVISRFRTASEIKKIKERFSLGAIDVIVGTHSLLSNDISYDNIGLLIVDEEHRFGVAHKEKIQSMEHRLDVLYMSATPIPRTLHMAFSGIRNISTLFTAPRARLPIITRVAYFDRELVRKAIKFEINRGGQVFFLHNKVKTIQEVTTTLKQLLPGLQVAFAHGQESTRTLEDTMSRFVAGEIDVLVCTSIIETGIDIENANTIIINNAHHFGLSQLYQIRGRVGRGARQAHAFLLIPKHFQLSRKARRRLKTIEENTSLGSGYTISKTDLEIRGAGTLFGYKQHGGSGGVGFELYTSFIKEALRKKVDPEPSGPSPGVEDVTISLFADISIPDDFIASTERRLGFYRKISLVDTVEELNHVEYEMVNRFGTLPESVRHLLITSRIRLLCATVHIKKVAYKAGQLVFEFGNLPVSLDVAVLIESIALHMEGVGWNYWFKQNDNKDFILVIPGVLQEDISSLVRAFLDKLRDVF